MVANDKIIVYVAVYCLYSKVNRSVLVSLARVKRLSSSAVFSTETGTLFHKGQPAQGNVQLMSGSSLKRRFLLHTFSTRTKLVDIERKVQDDLKRNGATSANVGGIVFLCKKKHLDSGTFLFQDSTTFLDLSGASLFEKLTVVPLTPNLSATAPLKALSDKGVRFLDVNKPSVVLPNALSRVAKAENGGRNQLQDIYRKAAQRVRRNGEQAVILLAGQTGHGKSKTVNRLIGKEILMVGRGTLGSTTKDIERVQFHHTSKELSSDIEVVFDDTPGVEQTTSKDTESTASLLQRYKDDHFTDIYPNVILLVAEWGSIKPDAHNEPAASTSALGKTIYALHLSNLVDEQRSNIVVVVTKSRSSLHEFDDYTTPNEKDAQWRVEEGRRRGIITDLQRKRFPRSSPWEIAFIDNGGGSDMSAKLPVLPDGLLSHQNLYDAICNIVKRPSSDGSLDLVGIQSVQVLAGAERPGSLAEPQKKVLVGASKQKQVQLERFTNTPLLQFPDPIMHERASNYLGVTFDNAVGTFGCTNVLEEQNIVPRRVEKHPEMMFHPLLPHNLTGELDQDRLRSHYSSDWAFRAAVSRNSQCHILHCASRVVTASNPQLSADMQTLIKRLPPWSREEQPKYTQFFKNYGTHVITQLVLGGTVRAIAGSTNDPKKPTSMIFRDGGAAVAAEFTVYLEEHFRHLASSSGWKETCERWILALEKEPVFCPDHEITQYKAIHEFEHLTLTQQTDLARAYRSYIASWPQNDKTSTRRPGHDWESLQRPRNLAKAVNDHVDAVTQALYRTCQGR
ncbi:hypothetical protein K438DRAFT_1782159 [Mycena galopus ATCC 62051]|nr:hypothetical protein K438DRAFT_1782159 [Mycena galopus ATCC 62051]